MDYKFKRLESHYKKHVIPKYQSDWDFYVNITLDEYLKAAEDFANAPIGGEVKAWKNKKDDYIIKTRPRQLDSLKSYEYDFIMYKDSKIYSMYPISGVDSLAFFNGHYFDKISEQDGKEQDSNTTNEVWSTIPKSMSINEAFDYLDNIE